MKVLCCGTNVPNEIDVDIEKLSLAGNRFQNNIFTFINKNVNSMNNISYIAIPMNTKEINIVEKECNKIGIKYFIKQDNFVRSIFNFRNELKKELINNDIVFAYNIVYAWFGLARMAKIRKCKSIIILADYSSPKSYKNVIMKIYSFMCGREIKKYDIVVGLSKNIINVTKKNQIFICMEGGIDLNKYIFSTPTELRNNEKIRIMYSGSLISVTGVDLFIKSISKINNDNLEFIITGRGNLDKLVVETAKMDKRIKFLGSLEYSEYMNLLNNAHILVNPRNMNLPENQNNFPSKYIEYLAVGKVLVSTKFPGFEKFENTAFFCDSTSESIKSSLEEAINTYENIYKDKYKYNKKFVKKFDWNNQIKKIMKQLKK